MQRWTASGQPRPSPRDSSAPSPGPHRRWSARQRVQAFCRRQNLGGGVALPPRAFQRPEGLPAVCEQTAGNRGRVRRGNCQCGGGRHPDSRGHRQGIVRPLHRGPTAGGARVSAYKRTISLWDMVRFSFCGTVCFFRYREALKGGQNWMRSGRGFETDEIALDK